MSDKLLQEIKDHLKRIEQVTNSYMGQMQQKVAEQETRQLQTSLEVLSEQDRLERADLFFNRAEQFYFQGKMAEAANEYRKVVLADPKHLPASYKLANLCSMRREFDEAIINYRECLKIDPTFYEAQQRLLIQYVYMYEDYSGRKDMLERIVQRLENRTSDGDTSPLDLYSAALSYLLMESSHSLEVRLEKADHHLNTLINSSPQDPHYLWAKKLAVLHYEKDKLPKKSFKEALKYCDQALKLNKHTDQALYEIGEVYELEHRIHGTKVALSKAEDYYQKALEHNKYHLPSLVRLASIFEERFAYDEALGCLKVVVSQDPFHAQALWKLSNIYHFTRFLDQAIDGYSQLATISHSFGYNPYLSLISLHEPENLHELQIYQNLARSYESSHKLDEAINEYRKILDHQKDHILAGEKLIDLHTVKFRNQENATEAFDQLIKQYKNAAFLEPNNAILSYLLGYAYFKFSNFYSYHEELLARAIQQMEKALRIDENLKEAYFSLKDIYLSSDLRHTESDSLDKALNFCRKALSRFPEIALCHYHHGEILDNQGLYEESIESFEQAIKLDPALMPAYSQLAKIHHRQGNLSEAIKTCDAILQRLPNDAWAHFEKGQIHYLDGDSHKALQELTQAIELDPTFIKSYSLIGQIYFENENHEKALVQYLKILDYDNRNAIALLRSGLLQNLLSKPLEARKHLELLLKIEPDDTRAILEIGHTYYAREEWAVAKERYREVLQHEPDNQVARFNLSKIFETLNELDSQEQELRELINIAPKHLKALLDLGNLYLVRDRIYEAEEIYKQALNSYPESLDALFELAKIYEQQNLIENMNEVLHRILEIDTENYQATYLLAKGYERKKQFDKALLHYQNAHKINPEDVDILYALGNLHFEQNKLTEAENYFSNCLERQFNHAASHQKMGQIKHKLNQFKEAISYFKRASEKILKMAKSFTCWVNLILN